MIHGSEQVSVEDTADALLIASRALVGVSARSLADIDDVTLVQFRALVILDSRQGVTVTQLAERLDVHPSTVSRLCDRLVRKRLIRRVGGNTDRREITLVLAAGGRRLVDRVTRRRQQDLVTIARRMSPEDRRHALVGLTAFAQAAGEIPEAGLFGWPPSDPRAASGPDAWV